MLGSNSKEKPLKYKILELRSKGFTYDEIKNELGCAKSTISYHCGSGNEKIRLKKNNSDRHPIIRKISAFRSRTSKEESLKQKAKKGMRNKTKSFKRAGHTHGHVNNINHEYTYKDVLKKIGSNPTCYLTGEPIDLNKPETYHLDHIIPTSKGGSNDLSNLGLCIKDANYAKGDLSLQDLYSLCKKICNYLKLDES